MVLAIENAGRFSSFGSLGITDELLRLIYAGNLEREENVVGFRNAAPEMDELKAGVPVGFCVGRENGLPP